MDASFVVPEAKGESVSRGLFFGFIEDWLGAAAHLLPGMEPIVRHLIKLAGGNTTVLDGNDVQRERTLNELLSMPEAEAFFVKNLIFELQSHLTDPAGFNLCNLYCHGLLSDQDAESAGMISLWWLIWRMVLFPWRDHPTLLALAQEGVDSGIDDLNPLAEVNNASVASDA
ncbi:DUF4209 domain-containing protein [Luteimonas fraxinea]|uniref:DUF4209 domain-containing protein n=1 Tax=Luteimonas fraxinea TaxID=2901869 RepID=A0ABS8UGS7_9GAMM|nr:DUF4209 domain-containing protein [Luteimonas fraxinea]MCD9098042.1 DUF4209 domain-containing protein [Luteimonas fraxinea]UHH09233.1 DUF4209 domain-containing protein [Luteimonas fraxinea]